MGLPPSRAASVKTAESHEAAYDARVKIGLALCALLIVGIGSWATFSSLAGAVVAPGHVVMESSIKKVQHPTGGVVGSIHVKSGDHVKGGDLLLRLDDTQTRANLGVIVSQLTELTGRKARLAAERDTAEAVDFPAGFEAGGEDAMRVASGERKLFAAKRQSLESQKSQLRERVGQFRHEIAGLSRQEKAKAREQELVSDELKRLEDMYRQKLVPVTRVLAMQRDTTRIAGEHGALLSQIAKVDGQITETELKIIQLDETARAEAQRELREVEARLGELEERRVAAQDVLTRVEIRAPHAGIVHELAVHTVGGVIPPGDTVMGIVPVSDSKVVEVQLSPTDIDQVVVGQKARLRFPAFNQRTTPELDGTVSRIGADLTHDSKSGTSYYVARITIDEGDLTNLRQLKLVAGMPVEAFIQTGERTALSYFAKPFTDQLARAFREE